MQTVSRLDDDPGPALDVRQVVAQQRRQRLVRFWIGFVVILVLGGLWAGLSKDPTGFGDVFGDDEFFDQPAVEAPGPPPDAVFTTTAVPSIDTTGPPSTTTTTATTAPPSTTASPSTTGPSSTTASPSTTGGG